MPLVHERTFRVRHYECDAYGHVNNVNYVRYMQEAAFDASAAAGYDMARYAALGQHWLVRETEVEYLQPLRYGEAVTVRTWVADFRRVLSRREYELRRAADGERVARGSTDWVYVDRATSRPASIPPELIQAFFPEGTPAAAPRRQPLPEPPPAPAGKFVMRRKVLWQDIDTAGHVNNANYLAYVSDCGFEIGTAHGWPAARMVAEGFAVLVRRMRIEYNQPAVLDDELEIATWFYRVRRVTAMRAYTITRPRDGALIARAQGLYAWVSLATGAPCRVPAALLTDFGPNYAEEIDRQG